MFNRYTIGLTPEEFSKRFSVDTPAHYRPRFNAAPSQLLPVITASAERGISWFFWGLPPQRSRQKPVSEKFTCRRAAELTTRPALRRHLLSHRCEIPADGFYVWKPLGKKTLVPYLVRLPDNEAFTIAGVWEEFESETGEMQHTFTVVTHATTGDLANLTDQAPLLLTAHAAQVWGGWHRPEKDILEVLNNYAQPEMRFHPVSPAIEDARLDTSALTAATPPADQFGNLTLFG